VCVVCAVVCVWCVYVCAHMQLYVCVVCVCVWCVNAVLWYVYALVCVCCVCVCVCHGVCVVCTVYVCGVHGVVCVYVWCVCACTRAGCDVGINRSVENPNSPFGTICFKLFSQRRCLQKQNKQKQLKQLLNSTHRPLPFHIPEPQPTSLPRLSTL